MSLHGGVQMMRSYVGRSVYVIGRLRLFQSAYRKYLKCVRFAAQTMRQQKAPLPAVRVNPSRPFACSGVDYAGPIFLFRITSYNVCYTKLLRKTIVLNQKS